MDAPFPADGELPRRASTVFIGIIIVTPVN
jgi:hypothetical protein